MAWGQPCSGRGTDEFVVGCCHGRQRPASSCTRPRVWALADGGTVRSRRRPRRGFARTFLIVTCGHRDIEGSPSPSAAAHAVFAGSPSPIESSMHIEIANQISGHVVIRPSVAPPPRVLGRMQLNATPSTSPTSLIASSCFLRSPGGFRLSNSIVSPLSDIGRACRTLQLPSPLPRTLLNLQRYAVSESFSAYTSWACPVQLS